MVHLTDGSKASPDSQKADHRGQSGRTFPQHSPNPCYALTPVQKSRLPPTVLSTLSKLPLSSRTLLQSVPIPARDAAAVKVSAGCIVRLSVTHGPQVADLNVWNANNPAEKFYASKTRQIHATHLSKGDSLWSAFPYVRPLLTIVADSIEYGIDSDNAGVHDVIGSRCDPYTHAVMTGMSIDNTCHSNLTRVIKPHGLDESDVHDVLNVFMCTGFAPRTGIYFSKPSPARKGDYVDFFTHVDALVAVSACRQGDVSTACGAVGIEPRCFPLGIEVFKIPDSVLNGWSPPQQSPYRGSHGMD